MSNAMCKISECISMSMNQLNHTFTPNQLVVPNHQAVLAHSRGVYHPGYVNYEVQSLADICGYTTQSHSKDDEESQYYISFLQITQRFYYFEIYEH